jgi:hypothetical protein
LFPVWGVELAHGEHHVFWVPQMTTAALSVSPVSLVCDCMRFCKLVLVKREPVTQNPRCILYFVLFVRSFPSHVKEGVRPFTWDGIFSIYMRLSSCFLIKHASYASIPSQLWRSTFDWRQDVTKAKQQANSQQLQPRWWGSPASGLFFFMYSPTPSGFQPHFSGNWATPYFLMDSGLGDGYTFKRFVGDVWTRWCSFLL